MSPVTATRFEFIPIQMNVSTSIIRDALAPYELKNLAAKIVALAVYPFLLIAAFEAIVINGTKILLNSIILLLNTAHGCFFPNEKVFFPICSEQPETKNGVVEQSDLSTHFVPMSETMSPPKEIHRKKIEYLVRCLEKDTWYELGLKSGDLNQLKVDLAEVHPFQFLDAIFGKYSKVKNCMPGVMARSLGIPGQFLGGFKSSMETHPTHRKMVGPYLHSFAQKVEIPSEKLQSFLIPTHNWAGLVNLLIEKHCKPART